MSLARMIDGLQAALLKYSTGRRPRDSDDTAAAASPYSKHSAHSAPAPATELGDDVGDAVGDADAPARQGAPRTEALQAAGEGDVVTVYTSRIAELERR
jgi:hypothetical protein